MCTTLESRPHGYVTSCASTASLRRTGLHCTCGLVSPDSGRACVKSLRSSYMGLYRTTSARWLQRLPNTCFTNTQQVCTPRESRPRECAQHEFRCAQDTVSVDNTGMVSITVSERWLHTTQQVCTTRESHPSKCAHHEFMCTIYTLHPTPYRIYHTPPNTLYLHPTPYTLNSSPYTILESRPHWGVVCTSLLLYHSRA